MIERTLVLLKPDAVQRCVSGEILSRFERAGLKVVGMKMVWCTPEMAKKHYKAHVSKPFYPGLEGTITEGPVIAIALEGIKAVENVRKMVGPTEPFKAPPGTIRGDYAHITMEAANARGKAVRNLVHASGNLEEAKEELALWFRNEDLHTYKTVHEAVVM
jgi:nucleoside-diphosphate kinase